MVELIVSPEYLAGGEKVLIIDDFLATGATILGLVRLTQAAGAKIVGMGTLIEKTLRAAGRRLHPWECQLKPGDHHLAWMVDKLNLQKIRKSDRFHCSPGFWFPIFTVDCPQGA